MRLAQIWVHLVQPLLQWGHPEQGARPASRWHLKFSREETTASQGSLHWCLITYTAQKYLLGWAKSVMPCHWALLEGALCSVPVKCLYVFTSSL